MAREPEDAARDWFEKSFGLRFGSPKQLDSWGTTDGAVELAPDRWALLEVETTQKHPCTNVLKVWPYLEEHPEQSVVLVHLFTAGARNERGNRANLGTWVACKMTSVLGARFTYLRLVVDSDGSVVGDLEKVRSALSPSPGNTQSMDRASGVIGWLLIAIPSAAMLGFAAWISSYKMGVAGGVFYALALALWVAFLVWRAIRR